MNHMQQKYREVAQTGPGTWAEAPVQMTGSTPRIAYRAGGNEQGVPVVLLHSLAADQTTWAPVAEVLERDHYVITLDSRGHGSSDIADTSGPRAWALDIIDVLDALNIQRALLVGVSMGGIQAIATAAAAPGRVAGIIVADSFAYLPEEVSSARIEGLSGFASQHAMKEVAHKYVNDTFVASGDVRGPELMRKSMGAMERGSYVSAVRACFGADVRPALEQVKAPALVLWGELDEKTPRTLSMDIAAAIPNAAFNSIPHAAHLSHLDQPAIFASLVSRFANSLADGPTRD
jgi:pimeloyl-ACP methyl ester carboxylesterase